MEEGVGGKEILLREGNKVGREGKKVGRKGIIEKEGRK